MSTGGAFAPEGFCPQCGYAMGPGRCSECGLVVPKRRLARSPHLRRRRWRSVLTIAGVLVMLVVALRVDWLDVAPTGLLLQVQGFGTARINQELRSRHRAGALSAQETERMFKQGTQALPELRIGSPRPVGMDVWIATTLNTALELEFHIDVQEYAVIVDGRPVPVRPILDGRPGDPNNFGWGISSEVWPEIAIDPLGPGDHMVTALWTVDVFDSSAPTITPLGVSFSIVQTRTITVSEQPIESFVAPRCTPEIAAQLMPSITVWAAARLSTPSEQVGVLRVRADKPQLPIAGFVYYRHSGDKGGWQSTDLTCRATNHTHDTSVGIAPSSHPGADLSVDVMFVPDSTLAFHAGFTEYFGGTLHWRSIPLDANPGGIGWQTSGRYGVPADDSSCDPPDPAPQARPWP